MTHSPPTPVIVGAAQFMQQKDAQTPLDPLGLMAEAGRRALASSGTQTVGEIIDAISVANIVGWSYADAPSELAQALGLSPSETTYLPIGGQSPQMMVNRAAMDIAAGKHRAVLLAGGEADYAIRRALKSGLVLNWPEQRQPEKIDGDMDLGISELESRYQLFFPAPVYAMFETAIRYADGRDHEAHMKHMGRLLEPFSRIAADHPHGWLETAYTADEIATPGPKNRYIAYPYTLRMVSNRYVDQSAAIIITSTEMAEKAGIDRKHWVFPMGGADLGNISHVSQRPFLHNSPATRQSARLALEQSGLTLDDMDMFDIYSCFPSMIEMGRREIGIPTDDPRGLTVTGGLPFFGGPFNNYSMHAIVTVVDRIRENPAQKAMVFAQGGFNTKASVGIYGTEPPAEPWGSGGVADLQADVQASIDGEAMPEPVDRAEGRLRVEAYTLHYDRSGHAESGTVIGRLENDQRALARIDAYPEILRTFETKELVGRTGGVRFDEGLGLNLFTPGAS
ncbi:MAG: acetyl-CoA acetyltransferase [Thermodesulfobacteriota bacterium]|nr:acetyl-CoA acetyltransferase [Thermodesulfobacteriota bacterium]